MMEDESDDEGIVYPYYSNDAHTNNNNNNHNAGGGELNYNMFINHPMNEGCCTNNNNNNNSNEDMVCAAMSILLCPPHEGIAREYQELPPTQQNEVWNDLTGNGSANCLEETPEFIQAAIIELAYEIQNNNILNKQAFELAMSKSPDFVNDPSFILRFLRAERFNPNLAAIRMTNWEEKLYWMI
eukprot:scaffold102_cov103-Cylindrotheca_fusiformis.AAC.1